MERKMYVMKTSFGNVMLTPTDGKHIYVSTDKQLENAPSIRVNGVDYKLGGHIYLWPDGVWKFGCPDYPNDNWREPDMSRVDAFRNGKYDPNPSSVAKNKVRMDLAKLINEWVETHPMYLGDANMVALKEKLERARATVSEKAKELEEAQNKLFEYAKEIDKLKYELDVA